MNVKEQFDEQEKITPKFDSIGAEAILEEVHAHLPDVTSEIPLHVLPRRVKHMVTATHEVYNFPIEYTVSTLLFAVSLAIGKNCKIVPKPGWYENGSLWFALVGRSGAVKSPVLKYILDPIYGIEKRENQEYDKLLAEYESLSKAERLAEKEPVCINYYTKDTTPEALLELHGENPDGVGYISDELASFFENLNRYQNNSEGLFLTGWDGSGVKVTRMNRPRLLIDELYVPIIGGTQPAKLSSLAAEGRDSSGFMARILFAFPEKTNKPLWNDKQLSEAHTNYWASVLEKLFKEVRPEKRNLSLKHDAYKLLKNWQHKNAKEVDRLGGGPLAEIFNKAERQCIRLILNLEMLYFACGESVGDEISERAVKGGIALIEYYKSCARKVCDVIYEPDPLEGLPVHKRDFIKALPDEFTAKEAIFLAGKFNISRSVFYNMMKIRGLVDRSKGHYVKLV